MRILDIYVNEYNPALCTLSGQFQEEFKARGGTWMGSAGAAVCLHALGVFINDHIPAGTAVTVPNAPADLTK